MVTTPGDVADQLGVSPKRVREVLRAHFAILPPDESRWDLTDEQVSLVTGELAGSSGRPLAGISTPVLLGRYAEILAELRTRGVVRTGNAPLGDYAEYVALDVYGGALAPNSAKSYDLTAADGRRVQVKARALRRGASRSAVFSVFRSFDFDVASLLVVDAGSYGLLWAREMTPQQIEGAARWSSHVNGHLLRIQTAEQLGMDVTSAYADVIA